MSALQTYLDFVMNYAPYFYYLPDQGIVDPEWGRGPAPASFAIEFLSEAYKTKEFENQKSSILNKVVELADYVLSIQCSDQAKLAYGGFKSKDESTYYYAIDAMRAVSALLKPMTYPAQQAILRQRNWLRALSSTTCSTSPLSWAFTTNTTEVSPRQ